MAVLMACMPVPMVSCSKKSKPVEKFAEIPRSIAGFELGMTCGSALEKARTMPGFKNDSTCDRIGQDSTPYVEIDGKIFAPELGIEVRDLYLSFGDESVSGKDAPIGNIESGFLRGSHLAALKKTLAQSASPDELLEKPDDKGNPREIVWTSRGRTFSVLEPTDVVTSYAEGYVMLRLVREEVAPTGETATGGAKPTPADGYDSMTRAMFYGLWQDLGLPPLDAGEETTVTGTGTEDDGKPEQILHFSGSNGVFLIGDPRDLSQINILVKGAEVAFPVYKKLMPAIAGEAAFNAFVDKLDQTSSKGINQFTLGRSEAHGMRLKSIQYRAIGTSLLLQIRFDR